MPQPTRHHQQEHEELGDGSSLMLGAVDRAKYAFLFGELPAWADPDEPNDGRGCCPHWWTTTPKRMSWWRTISPTTTRQRFGSRPSACSASASIARLS